MMRAQGGNVFDKSLEAELDKEEEKEEEKKFELKLEEIPAPKVSPYMWKYNSEEKESEKKWVYEKPEKFSAARKTLGYDKQERADLQPADLLQSYLPKEAPEGKKPEESDFDYQIKIRNDVATALKNNMVSPLSFTGLFTQARNHGRAARLVLLEEMLGVFNDALTNEVFNKEDIEKMSKELSVKLDKQKEFFRGPFNNELKRLQSNLAESTQRAIKAHKQLHDINAWIAAGNKKANSLKHNLVQIQDRITTLRDINGYDRLTIEARNKLSTYIATDSVIAKQLLDIDQGIEENPDQNKVSALAEQLKSLETALKEFQTICELPGGLLLMEKITHAYQTIALAHIHIAAKNYQENPSSYTREELLLTIESVISAVEKDYKGKKFGNREKYGKPLKAVLDILLKSPTNDKERLELENLSGRLVQVVLYQEQINKMEAAKKEVESNLRMLEEAGITPGESANPATVIIKELNKIREILLESLNPTDDDQRLVVEALKRAASHIPQKLSHLSLTLRIAINNIASKIKAEDGEFEKLLPLEEQVSPLPEFVAAEEEAAGTLGYEIKKFILSKFGSSINERIIAIAGQKFAPDVFFQEIFEGMNKVARQDDRSYDFMKKRIITILKASSMQGKEDSKVEIEATQILDCLKLYDVATTQGKEKSHLSDLTNEELLLSPFNLTLQQLKKYAAPAAIKTIINNYINLIFGNDAGAGFKKVYAIILAESTKQPFPDLAVVLLKLDEILGHKDYFHTPEFRNLLNIYIAVEKYQKCPDRSTQGNLICSLASAFNATEASKKAYIPSFYIKALQEIIQELITIEDDRSYLDTLFNYLDILSKLKTFIEAKGLREEAASAQGQVQVEEKEGEYLQLFALLLTQASMWRPQSSSPVATPLFFHHPHLDPQVVSDSPAAKAIMYEIKRYIESMLEVNSDDDKRFDTALNIMKMPEKDHNKQQKIRKDVFRLEGKVRPKGGYTASQNYQDVRQQYELFYFLKIYIAAENYNLTPSPENYIALMQIPLHLCGQVKASEGDDNNKSPYYLPTLLAIVFLLQDLPSKGGTLNELYEKKEEDRPVFTQKEKDIGKTLAAAENYNLTPLLENHTALMQIPLHLAIGFLLQDLPSDVLTEKDKDILNELYGKREEDRPVFTQEEKDRGKTLADAARKFITNGRNVSNKPAPMQ